MPDYGHELRFGSFITPVNARPQQVVDLAVLGLGTGGFWDAIAAMGGPRRTAGESPRPAQGTRPSLGGS